MTRVLAIDIGGTNTKLALVEPSGKVGEVTSTPTDGEMGVDHYLRSLVRAAEDVISNNHEEVEGVGIGVAGFIDPAHTKMTFNPNISWMEGVNLKDFFCDKLKLPVVLEIDSNAAALAEYAYGNGKDSRRLLVFTIGTGLGGGMIVQGDILRIAHECLGDVGHILVEPGGLQCASGCKGCAEAMVSASALERYAMEFISQDKKSKLYALLLSGGKIHTPEIIKAAHEGDIAAEKAIHKLGDYLGIALASITPLMAPDRICIAGGVSEAGSILIDAAKKNFHKMVGPPYAEGIKIHKAKLGWQTVLIGAAEAYRKVASRS